MSENEEWHAPDCGGTCDGCGYIAEDGGWYPGPTPAHLVPFQQAWSEDTPTYKVLESGCTCCGPWLVESPAPEVSEFTIEAPELSEFTNEEEAWEYAGRQQQSIQGDETRHADTPASRTSLT